MPDIHGPAGLHSPSAFTPLPAQAGVPATSPHSLGNSVPLTARGSSSAASSNTAPRSAKLPLENQAADDEGRQGDAAGAAGAADAKAAAETRQMVQQYLMKFSQEMLSKQEETIKQLFAKNEDDEDPEPDD
jgi:hypothetical protein